MDPTEVVDFLNKLGTLNPEGMANFQILVENTRLRAIGVLFVLGGFFALSFPFMLVGFLGKIRNDENWENWTLALTMFLIGGCLLLASLIGALFVGPGAYASIENPEYETLKNLYNSTVRAPVYLP